MVDNTTLTSIQRLLGDIRVGNLYNVDGDITAFENFIQTMLLFEKVFVIDDYKPEDTAKRKQLFSFLEFIHVPDDYYETLKNISRSYGETLKLKITGNSQENRDLQEILNLIDLRFIGAWRMSGSNFYLYLEILTDSMTGDRSKYGPLLAALMSQAYSIQGARSNDAASFECEIRSSNGQDALAVRMEGNTRYAPGPELTTMVSHLNWLSYRSYFYLAFACNENISMHLHPIRHAFLAGFLEQAEQSKHTGQRIISHITGDVREAIEAINEISAPEIIDADFPMFAAWIAAHSRGPDEFLPKILELRDDRSFQQLRKKLDHIEEMRIENDVARFKKHINKMYSDMLSTIDEVKSRFGMKTDQGIPLSPAIAVANVPISIYSKGAVKLPDPKLNIPKPKWFIDAKYRFSYRAF